MLSTLRQLRSSPRVSAQLGRISSMRSSTGSCTLRTYATTIETHPAAQTTPNSSKTAATSSSPSTNGSDSTPPPIPPTPPPTPEKPPQRKDRRNLRRVIYAAVFLMLGLTAGQMVRFSVLPPPLPLPHSHEDKLLIASLVGDLDKLDIVQQLRADPYCREWEAYSAFVDPADRAHRLTTGPMAGTRGLPVQRVFWNEATGEATTVVFIGGGLGGWPGVTHGGALATLLDESLGRVAAKSMPARTAVTANLELQYRAPTLVNRFYVIKAGPVHPDSRTDRKAWVNATLETIDGRVCVEAKGLFVVPKGFKLGEIKDGF